MVPLNAPIALTAASALESHPSNTPELELTAASRLRAWPLTLVKEPPKYRFPPVRTSALTEPPAALGCQVGSTVRSARICARFVRTKLPTRVNEPATNQPPASSLIACRTAPLICGNTGSTCPVVGETGAPPPTRGATAVKKIGRASFGKEGRG